jgi:hypothetical protein
LDIVLVTGGPAEMNSLVRPVAYRAALAFSAADIWVFSSPGSQALAREVRIASTYRGVRRAFGPREAWNTAYVGLRPRGFTVSGRGVVVNLGGDSGFAAALARRLRYPLIHYVSREYPVVPRGSALYLVEDERVQAALIAGGAAPASVRVVGDLCLDVAATMERSSGLREPASAVANRSDGSVKVIGLFPGDGLREARQMGPFMLKAAGLLARVERGTSFILRLSPFIGTASLDSVFKPTSRSARSDAAAASIDRSAVPFTLITEEGVRVPIDVGPDHSALYSCDAVLTVPGPLCHELAYAGVPYIVVAPRGLVSRRGGRWARMLSQVRAVATRSQPAGGSVLVSGPNMRAGRDVAREVVGSVRPEDVVIPVVEMIGDPAAADRVARGLKETVGLPGAADAVIQGIRSSVPG